MFIKCNFIKETISSQNGYKYTSEFECILFGGVVWPIKVIPLMGELSQSGWLEQTEVY